MLELRYVDEVYPGFFHGVIGCVILLFAVPIATDSLVGGLFTVTGGFIGTLVGAFFSR